MIVTRVHSMAEDGTLVAFRDPRDGVRRIPAEWPREAEGPGNQ